MEAGIFILAGKKQRYSGGWRDSGSGIVAILAAVFFFGGIVEFPQQEYLNLHHIY